MLAQIFDTAKRFLSRSPSVPERAQYFEELAIAHPGAGNGDMVTTRRGTDSGNGPSTENTPAGSVTRGRAKRQLHAEDRSTPSKRTRRTTTPSNALTSSHAGQAHDRKQDPDVGAGSASEFEDILGENITLEIADRTKSSEKEHVSQRRPASQAINPRVVIPAREPHDATNSTTTVPETSTPTLPRDASDDADEHAAVSTPTRATRSNASRPTTSRRSTRRNGTSHGLTNDRLRHSSHSKPRGTHDGNEDSTREDESSFAAADASVSLGGKAAQATHMRFDDDEGIGPPAFDQTSQVGQDAAKSFDNSLSQRIADERSPEHDSDASDSDEAPEMVTAAAATSKLERADQVATHAQQALQRKLEAKREARAERVLLEQAEKRRREERKAKKLAKRQAKEIMAVTGQNLDTVEPFDLDMSNLPALLPASLLEAAGDRRPPTPPPSNPLRTAEDLRREKLHRHIKFLERGDRHVKDQRKGSINVSVLAKHNRLLAPKYNKATKNMREEWLKGRHAGAMRKQGKRKFIIEKMERRVVGGGFLRRQDV